MENENVQKNVGRNSNDYMGYSLFNDVSNKVLQAFNRARVIKNIKDTLGVNAAIEYLDRFNSVERLKISVILLQVKETSWELVGRDVRLGTT